MFLFLSTLYDVRMIFHKISKLAHSTILYPQTRRKKNHKIIELLDLPMYTQLFLQFDLNFHYHIFEESMKLNNHIHLQRGIRHSLCDRNTTQSHVYETSQECMIYINKIF